MLDMNLLLSGLENDKPVETMKEFLTCRHLAPVYGKRTQIAPVSKDWLVIENIPDIFHTGHVHINGFEKYKGVSLVNSGCFQSQTDFMKSFGIIPTPGIVPIIELDTYNCLELDLKTTWLTFKINLIAIIMNLAVPRNNASEVILHIWKIIDLPNISKKDLVYKI